MSTIVLEITHEAAEQATRERKESYPFNVCRTCLVANLLGKATRKAWSVGLVEAQRIDNGIRIYFPDDLREIVQRFTAFQCLDHALIWFKKKYPNGYKIELTVKNV